jgi:hypothetical protein
MGERNRRNTGEYVEEISTDDVLTMIRNTADPIVTTNDVGEALGCSTETARRKLTELAEAGTIERRQVGANAVVWWIPDLFELDRRADELWAGEGISFEEWAAEDA